MITYLKRKATRPKLHREPGGELEQGPVDSQILVSIVPLLKPFLSNLSLAAVFQKDAS